MEPKIVGGFLTTRQLFWALLAAAALATGWQLIGGRAGLEVGAVVALIPLAMGFGADVVQGLGLGWDLQGTSLDRVVGFWLGYLFRPHLWLYMPGRAEDGVRQESGIVVEGGKGREVRVR